MTVPGEPFTIGHFCEWASHLELDNGKPWIVEDFQADFVSDLFLGRPENWFVLPEGNAKTTLVGGVGLYHIEFVERAYVPCAGPSRDQAETLYRQVEGMVDASGLAWKFRCLEGYRRIRCDSNGSRLQIFAADDRTGDGVIPTLCLLEELHRHRDLRLYRTWRGKLGKRGGQLVAISTGGTPGSEFEEAREAFKASGVAERRGAFTRVVTDRLVFHEYAVPEDGDVEDLEQVKAANPLAAITLEQLEEKRASPAMTIGHWRRFVCGQPAGDTEQAIRPEEWDPLRVDIGQVEDGEAVICVPSVGHNAAIAIVALREHGRVAAKVEILAAPAEGSILAAVEDRLRELYQTYEVEGVYHPLGAFVRSADLLQAEGFPMIQAPHSPTGLAAASGTFNKALRSGQIMHDGDPELRAHVLQATLKTSEQGERYEISDRSRGLIALVMAVHAATALELEPYVGLPSEGIG